MTTDTIAVIFIAVFTVLFGIIGWFISRTISGYGKNIGKLFDRMDIQDKTISDLKLEVVRDYVSKEDCRNTEQDIKEALERIRQNRERFKKLGQENGG